MAWSVKEFTMVPMLIVQESLSGFQMLVVVFYEYDVKRKLIFASFVVGGDMFLKSLFRCRFWMRDDAFLKSQLLVCWSCDRANSKFQASCKSHWEVSRSLRQHSLDLLASWTLFRSLETRCCRRREAQLGSAAVRLLWNHKGSRTFPEALHA